MPRAPFASALGLVTLLLAPAAASAQDGLGGEWSTIIRGRSCPVAADCPPRKGLVWDTTNVRPAYPPTMAAAGIGGDAIVIFRVGRDGAVDSLTVAQVRASNPAFAAPAIAAVRRWRFGTEAEGRPDMVTPVQVHVLFTHEGGCPAPAKERWTAWAGVNQLVVGACSRVIPRSQLRQPK